MADFPYSSDIGTDSLAGIKSLERSSGIALPVVSDFRPGDPGLHGKMNAVDFGGSAESMRQVSEYLLQYAPYLLELIHTDYTMKGGGAYVKNGKVVPQSFYNGPDITTGGNIITGHVDHIHLAATKSGLLAAAAATAELQKQMAKDRVWQKVTGDSGPVGRDPSQPEVNTNLYGLGSTRNGDLGSGCAKRAAIFLIGITVPVSTLITFLVR